MGKGVSLMTVGNRLALANGITESIKVNGFDNS